MFDFDTVVLAVRSRCVGSGRRGDIVMTEKLRWTNETHKLSDLHPWPRNPRKIDSKQAERLGDSFDTFGQVETIAIGPDGEVYNGHQRIKVLLDKHGDAYEVDVRVSSRPLTEKEREQLTVYLHRGATGEWNFDLFEGWDADELVEWGFERWEFGIDYTSTDRDGQGFASPWSIASETDESIRVAVVIGDIETHIDRETFDLLSGVLGDRFNESNIPFFESMIDILRTGCRL